MIKKISKPFKSISKKVKPMVALRTNLVKSILIKVWAGIKHVLNLVWKLVKVVWVWLLKAFVETLNQLWTLLGMFAAWLVLEGSAKTMVGYAIILVLIVWLVTIRVREGE